MWFSRKRKAETAVPPDGANRPLPTVARGAWAEQLACDYLTAHGLRLLQRNYRPPGRASGEIDLVMREADGTLVFVEVRQRRSARHGGAAASIGRVKQRRLLQAARHFLLRYTQLPPCRFDAVLLEGEPAQILWVRAAFAADEVA